MTDYSELEMLTKAIGEVPATGTDDVRHVLTEACIERISQVVLSKSKAREERMRDALRPFAKAGELFKNDQSEWAANIYNPAAGKEYGIDSFDLKRALEALKETNQ